jgi:hypothetical protein
MSLDGGIRGGNHWENIGSIAFKIPTYGGGASTL